MDESKLIDIALLRIDDRLIHGQIITKWLSNLKFDTIIVADDKAANDPLEKTLLQMATPNKIDLKVFSIDQAIKFLTDKTQNLKAFILVRNTNAALKIVEKLTEANIRLELVNVGNISMNPNKKKIFKAVWVDDQDIENLKKIEALGIKTIVQVIPEEKPIPFFNDK